MEKALSFKGKLALSAAVVSAIVGYGRRAYAAPPGCYPTAGSTYLCSGAATSPQSFSTVSNISVSTTSDFSITSGGTAISFTGTGALSFNDNYGSDINSNSGDGLYFSSGDIHPPPYGPVSITITTGQNGNIHGGINGINAISQTNIFYINSAISISTGAGSSITGGTTGISAKSIGLNIYNSSSLVITTGTNSSVSGGMDGIYGHSGGGFSGNTTLIVNTGLNSTVSGGTNGISAISYRNQSSNTYNTLSITTGAGSTISGGMTGIDAHTYSSSDHDTDLLLSILIGERSTVSGGREGIFALNHVNSSSNINSTLSITTGIGSTVSGKTSGVYANNYSGNISILNKGTIQNSSGSSSSNAITTMGMSPSTTITNSGRIVGTITLQANGANNITNNGDWNTAGGTNNFAYGATITNGAQGTISAAISTATTPVTTTFNYVNSFNNAGVITMQNNIVGDRVVVQGPFVGQGGSVLLDTVLNSDNSPSDQLLITGSAAGSTQIFVHNVGGSGALTTADGIKVVEINAPTSQQLIAIPIPVTPVNPDAFILGGRAVAGIYEYQLFYGGNPATGGDPNDHSWYLRSTRLSGLPNYRVELPVDMVVPLLAKQFGLAMLDTLDDRVGNKAIVDESRGPWVRIIGQAGERQQGNSFTNFSNKGPSYNWGIGGVQVGYDIYNQKRDNGSSESIGVDLAFGRVSSDVNQIYSSSKAGQMNMDGYTFGAYWTHYAQTGWYTDTVLQGTAYNQMHAQSVLGQTLSTAGQGYLASFESGWIVAMNHGLSLTPEAQIVYQSVNINHSTDDFGSISYGLPDNFYGRVGARIAKDWTFEDTNKKPITTWARLNLWHNFNANSTTTFATLSGENPVTFTSDIVYSCAQISIGASGQLNKRLALFASGDGSANFSGGNGQVWAGRLGVRYIS